MTPQDFVYWLQGFVELQNPDELTKEQWQTIKDHLVLATSKVTPTRTLWTTPQWQYPHIQPQITC